MSYEIDRNAAVEPSLTEMALKALDDLYDATKKTEKGFFIMIEASRIVRSVFRFLFEAENTN